MLCFLLAPAAKNAFPGPVLGSHPETTEDLVKAGCENSTSNLLPQEENQAFDSFIRAALPSLGRGAGRGGGGAVHLNGSPEVSVSPPQPGACSATKREALGVPPAFFSSPPCDASSEKETKELSFSNSRP